MVYWYDFVLGPPGFYGKDLAIDLLSAVVVLAIAIFSMRNFFLDSKNYKHLMLSLAFFLLGLSFVAKIVTSVAVHDQIAVPVNVALHGHNPLSIFSATGFLVHAFLTLFGFYIIYVLSSKDKISMNYVVMAYFIVVSTYFSRFSYYVFYMTALLFTGALARRYFIQYGEFSHKNTLRLGISFTIIALSQLIFIFTYSSRSVYMFAELVQLAGYLFLLYTFVMVLNAGKKNKNRHNI